jgi:hypothetical protein
MSTSYFDPKFCMFTTVYAVVLGNTKPPPIVCFGSEQLALAMPPPDRLPEDWLKVKFVFNRQYAYAVMVFAVVVVLYADTCHTLPVLVRPFV